MHVHTYACTRIRGHTKQLTKTLEGECREEKAGVRWVCVFLALVDVPGDTNTCVPGPPRSSPGVLPQPGPRNLLHPSYSSPVRVPSAASGLARGIAGPENVTRLVFNLKTQIYLLPTPPAQASPGLTREGTA